MSAPRPTRAGERLAANALSASAMALIELHAREGQDLALQTVQSRQRAERAGYLLDGSCAALAVCAVMLLRRLLERQAQVEADRTRFANERACELESFAGRVAHDVSSPLSSVTTGQAEQAIQPAKVFRCR